MHLKSKHFQTLSAVIFKQVHFFQAYTAAMENAPAADRNKDAILDVLCKYLPQDFAGNVLEVASGTGQHIMHFAQAFPKASFQPSDIESSHLRSISAYKQHFNVSHVRDPLRIDITQSPSSWPGNNLSHSSLDVILNANMVHISPWQTAVGLFSTAAYLLKKDGLLFQYGPFAVDGVLVPESNVNFDKSLRSRDPSWGIRDTKDLQSLARNNGIQLLEMIDMPANNKTLIWKKL